MNEVITLDSNVFREQSFFDFLILNQEAIYQHNLPLIVYIEVLVWYEMISLTRQDLDDDLLMINTKVFEFNLNLVGNLLVNIRSNKNLPFRHHARDFLLGTQCINWDSNLITYNKKHFSWINKDRVFTPQEFIQKFNSDN